MTPELFALAALAFTAINTLVVVATYFKTAKVEKHTNGMLERIIAFERKDAGDIGEAKGRAKQKAEGDG